MDVRPFRAAWRAGLVRPPSLPQFRAGDPSHGTGRGRRHAACFDPALATPGGPVGSARHHFQGGNRLCCASTLSAHRHPEGRHWPARKHAGARRRVWRKVHLAMAEATLAVQSRSPAAVWAMRPCCLICSPRSLKPSRSRRHRARGCRDAIANRGADAVVPPRRTAAGPTPTLSSLPEKATRGCPGDVLIVESINWCCVSEFPNCRACGSGILLSRPATQPGRRSRAMDPPSPTRSDDEPGRKRRSCRAG